ncbi:MAG: hypothetical protein ACKO35_14905 [Planctomycetaceae bacterium]
MTVRTSLCVGVVVSCVLGFVGGCRDTKQPPVTLKLEDVPPELMRIAAEKLPGVTFDTAFQKASGTIEIRGRAPNGKIREVDIRPDGTVEEVE